MFSRLFAALTGNNSKQDALRAKLAQGALIVDVRSTAEYASNRVPGAKNVPLDLLERFAKKQKNKDQPIVLHCLSGARARQAEQLLKAKGFTDVTNAGGIAQLKRLLA